MTKKRKIINYNYTYIFLNNFTIDIHNRILLTKYDLKKEKTTYLFTRFSSSVMYSKIIQHVLKVK